MFRLTDLAGLAGLSLLAIAPVLALASAWWRRKRSRAAMLPLNPADDLQRRRRLLMLAVVTALVVNIPWRGMPVLGYLRALTGDLSMVSVLLLARAVWRQFASLPAASLPAARLSAPSAADRWTLHGLIIVAAALLYPASLGIGAFDPYRWGFGSFAMLAVLLVLALLTWSRGLHLSATAIALPVLAFATGWYESTNLWNYLIDPMLAVYALGAIAAALLRAANFRWQTLALLLTGFAWASMGLLQREPWPADEAASFGIVYSMLDDGQWLVPTLAGEPFVEKPPLVFWLAALCARAAAAIGLPQSPISPLSLHEAARMANVLIVLLTLTIVCVGARRAGLGRFGMVSVVALLAGTPTFLFFTRYLSADLGLLAGAAFASLGLLAWLRRDRDAGLWLGLGAAVGLMSTGLLLPAVLGLTCAVLVVLAPAARERGAFKQLAIALAVFLLAGFAWPLALHLQSPELFKTWSWANNIGGLIGDSGLGPANQRLPLLGAMLLTLLPVWPVALLAMYRKGRAFARSPLLGPLLFGFGWLGILMLFSTARARDVLPAVVPLALVAAAALHLPSAAAQRWLRDSAWPRRTLVALTIAALVFVAAAKIFYLLNHEGTALGSPTISGGSLLLLTVLLVTWFMAFRAGYKPRPLVLWVAAMTAAFTLLSALFLPGMDQKIGYRGVFDEVSKRLNPHAGCIASRGLGETERAMLHYYTGVKTRRFELDATLAAECPQWLERQRPIDDASQFGCVGGAERWSGRRPENSFDTFRVCRR